MKALSYFKLHTSRIKNIPLQNYEEKFTFIVNGKEYLTSKIVADLLSTKINSLHRTDASIDRYLINTVEQGDFSRFIDLITFDNQETSESEVRFFVELFEQLGNDSIELIEAERNEEITKENIIHRIQTHQQFKSLYSKSYEKDVEFLSTHFCDLDSLLKENISLFDFDTISAILSSNKLKLRDEDQLLDFVNILYSQDHCYSILYESVDFCNVRSEKITEFINTFEVCDLTNSIWHRICDRLKHSVSKTSDKSEPQGITFNKGEPFSGIINYLRQQSHDHIEQEINLTSSTIFPSDSQYQLQNITKFEDPNNGFASDRFTRGNWICIEFKNHQIIPTDYTIKSIGSYFTSSHFLKSWVIETSNDNNSWNIIDEVQNNTDLKGHLLTHTFTIKKPQNHPIRYLRLRLTDSDWNGANYLSMNSFELFGTLI